ncbi:hypothetical protein BCF74_103124 [Knoellia remsis]|uniref:DUF559 domain-containing protein n=1 Tax=Knoellia remsis TaxID=407159 RepID=A0A2T0UYI1_9MICO|nr:hypothetical protein [Knoellia remsis]PRY62917.1 hypothetical protein BCF74_103124 [Knoellia remsis]
MTPRQRRRLSRDERARRAAEVAVAHCGVAHRRDLRQAGVSRDDVRSEVTAGRWTLAGRHTVVINASLPLTGEAALWHAVWESGSGAVLDGVSALVAGGLTGFAPDHIDVAVPANHRVNRVDGVRTHRRRELGPTRGAGLPRVHPEWAVIRAARWARTDRTAVLLLCLVIQQRLVSPERLLATWRVLRAGPRQRLLEAVLPDICDGAHSLGELDFGALCVAHGVPRPSRQVVMKGHNGRIHLDALWEDIGLVVEVDGGHHALALAPVDDALRQNEVTLLDKVVLRVPVLGLRLTPEAFMAQVARAHAQLTQAAA